MFVARSSKLQILVVMASILPILVVGAVNLPLHPSAPFAVRIIGGLILLPFLIWMLLCLKALAGDGPVIEIDRKGLLWHRWSPQRIPWSAVERWQVKSWMGATFVTLWLKDRHAYPSTTINAWIAPGNRALGFGDITLNAGGTDRDFEELVAAFRTHAPLPPLPPDPRLARRLAAARERAARQD